MSANDPFASSAIERIDSIKRELDEIKTLIFRELHVIDKKPGLVDELIRRCEALSFELLEIRVAGDHSAEQPSGASNHRGPSGSPNGSGANSPQ